MSGNGWYLVSRGLIFSSNESFAMIRGCAKTLFCSFSVRTVQYTLLCLPIVLCSDRKVSHKRCCKCCWVFDLNEPFSCLCMRKSELFASIFLKCLVAYSSFVNISEHLIEKRFVAWVVESIKLLIFCQRLSVTLPNCLVVACWLVFLLHRGHINLTILSALQMSKCEDPANWTILVNCTCTNSSIVPNGMWTS